MKIEQLQNFYPKFLEEETNYLNFLTDPKYDTAQILLSLVSTNVNLGICNVKIKKDYLSARENFYKAALIKAYLHEKYDKGERTSYNIFYPSNGFMYAILSDSNKLINKFISYEDNFWKHYSASFAKSIQSCIKNDDIELIKQIKLLEIYTNKKTWEKNFSGTVSFFKGIINHDAELITQGIYEILVNHDKHEQPAIVKDFLSLEAITLAKLAYRKGIIVDIDHQFFPKEMIPVTELENYIGYDFLTEPEN